MSSLISIIGSLNIDHVIRTPHIPGPGETLTSSFYSTNFGGKGANQAIACARLSRTRSLNLKSDNTNNIGRKEVLDGIRVQMIGAVGEDRIGIQFIQSLSKNGLDVSQISVAKDCKTGMAIVMVEEESGENRILLCPNANYSLKPTLFDSLPSPTPSLLVLQLEIPLWTIHRILEIAKAHKPPIPVLLNAAPAIRLERDKYEAITHLVVNETEAATLAKIHQDDLSHESGLVNTARWFLAQGVKNVVITLGARGSYFMSSDGERGFGNVRKVLVVDTTAAGDTFIGGYAVDVMRQQVLHQAFSLSSAVHFGHMAAEKCVQRQGAQESIPWLDEV